LLLLLRFNWHCWWQGFCDATIDYFYP